MSPLTVVVVAPAHPRGDPPGEYPPAATEEPPADCDPVGDAVPWEEFAALDAGLDPMASACDGNGLMLGVARREPGIYARGTMLTCVIGVANVGREPIEIPLNSLRLTKGDGVRWVPDPDLGFPIGSYALNPGTARAPAKLLAVWNVRGKLVEEPFFVQLWSGEQMLTIAFG